MHGYGKGTHKQLQLYIVRHGQSERNATRSGPFDCPLTPLGEQQADRAGEWLKQKGIKTVYCSPSIRTLHTATIVCRHVGVKPIAWGDLVEWGYLFDSPGLTGRQMRTDFPHVRIGDEFDDDTPWIADKTDETWPALHERATAVLERLLGHHPPGSDPVLLVSHAHFARYLVAAALGFDEVQGLGGIFQMYNCGITMMEFKEDKRHLWYSNAHGHLEGLVTD